MNHQLYTEICLSLSRGHSASLIVLKSMNYELSLIWKDRPALNGSAVRYISSVMKFVLG